MGKTATYILTKLRPNATRVALLLRLISAQPAIDRRMPCWAGRVRAAHTRAAMGRRFGLLLLLILAPTRGAAGAPSADSLDAALHPEALRGGALLSGFDANAWGDRSPAVLSGSASSPPGAAAANVARADFFLAPELSSLPASSATTSSQFQAAGAPVTVDRQREKNTPEAALGANWQQAPFSSFSLQCSHNTYASGRQSSLNTMAMLVLSKSDGVSSQTMKTALSLGYRCIEIDVHEDRNGGESPVVTHALHGSVKYLKGTDPHMTNSAPFDGFPQVIKEWCDTKDDSSSGAPRLPIVISVENRVLGKKEYERNMADSFTRHLGSEAGGKCRILTAIEMAKAMQEGGNAVAIGTLMAQAPDKRLIIIKSEFKPGYAPAWEAMVSMSKPPKVKGKVQDPGRLACKSIAIKDATASKIGGVVSKGDFVRVYPNAFEAASANYNVVKAFQEKAQLVCINFQGKTLKNSDTCTMPLRGEATGGTCAGKRDVAADLENAFWELGYDGYVLISQTEAFQRFMQALQTGTHPALPPEMIDTDGAVGQDGSEDDDDFEGDAGDDTLLRQNARRRGTGRV